MVHSGLYSAWAGCKEERRGCARASLRRPPAHRCLALFHHYQVLIEVPVTEVNVEEL